MLTVFLSFVIFPASVLSQFLSYDAVRMRVPGRCQPGDFDCGFGQCVPILQFRDGKPDCMDGSDEWCYIGQVSCGPVYCADYKDTLPCLVYPKCDGSSKQLPWCSISKEKICADKRSFPCKGYGECVLWEWLLDGKKDCIDGSDEDENYVMPLEQAYRLDRNKSGIILTKPNHPIPPEDHQSLYVQGCSACPISPPAAFPPSETVDFTTPKYPFFTSPPTESIEQFPRSTEPPGDFFPGVAISKLTPTTKLEQQNIGNFFPANPSSPNVRINTISTNLHRPQPPLVFPPFVETTDAPSTNNWPIPISTESHVLPPVTYPPTDEGTDHKSTRIPPISPGHVIHITDNYVPGDAIINIPAKVISSKWEPPEIYPQEPISSENVHIKTVEPIKNVVTIYPPITRPPATTSSNYVAFKPVVPSGYGSVETHETHGTEHISTSDGYHGTENIPTSDINKGVGIKTIGTISGSVTPSPTSSHVPDFESYVPKHPYKPRINEGQSSEYIPYEKEETLIPLQPGQKLPSFPTFKPETTTKFSYVGSTGRVVSGRTTTPPPTLIPIAPTWPTEVVPSDVTETNWFAGTEGVSETTTEKQGWIKEKPEVVVVQTTATTSARVTSSTSQSKIIHVGPEGIVGEETTIETTEWTTKNMIRTQSTTASTTVTTTTPNSDETETETETTDVTRTTKRTEKVLTDPEVQDCLNQLMGNDMDIVCECENGKFKNSATGECEETLGLVNIKLNIEHVCEIDNAPFVSKQRLLHEKIRKSLHKNSCIKNDMSGDFMVATIPCEQCSLEEVRRLLNTRSTDEPGDISITAEAFGVDLCSDPALNHCHVYSECVVDNDGLRYACRCKDGTTDISSGYGRICDGFPEETDCVMFLGICMIVWLMLLLGTFMLTLLTCLASYVLCRKRWCCRRIMIHPENSEGLQTIVISGKRGEETSDKPMPHMKAIFAESLRHSAKGSTSVASAFALADFRRKKISKTPEMSQVVEEKEEVPATPTKTPSIPEVPSLPKIGSLARISTHTTISEPPTPVGVTETPILEKNSSSVSLVSTIDNAPQLPNLPLPLPVPMATQASSTSLEEKKEKPQTPHAVEEQKSSSQERPASSHSIGVQPTIWETYRVLGDQYSKPDAADRKPSIDSLEMMFEARLAETARTARTIKTERSSTSPITFTATPQVEETIPAANEEPKPEVQEEPPKSSREIKEEIEKNLEEANEIKEKEKEEKLAEMIGNTSYNTIHEESSSSAPIDEKITENTVINAISPSLMKSLDAALLVEMAKQGIELPLSPKTPPPTIDDLVKNQKLPLVGDSEIEDVTAAAAASRRSSVKSIPSGRSKSRIPSASRSQTSNGKRDSIKSETSKTDVFVPSGLKKPSPVRKGTQKSTHRVGDVASSTTDDSDPEVAFFKRLDRMREDVDSYRPVGRRHTKRRRPERTLSSISEKSAEILADNDVDYPVDTSASCPPTTRPFLEPQPPPTKRFIFRRKVVEATGDTSDVDVPKITPFSQTRQPIINSPEIPDVTLKRSMENLHKIEMTSPSDDIITSKTKTNNIAKKKNSIKGPTTSSVSDSRKSSRIGSRAPSPKFDDDAASHTSRSTRHSVISRKIAIRRHELKAVSGSAHDLSRPSISRSGLSSTLLRGSKSVSDLTRQRPPWDISQHRDRSLAPEFLPPIAPNRKIRTAANSPQPRNRRSNSHFSLSSLPAIPASHSPTAFWSSPYFNPSQDSRKPPKEDLWWSPEKKY